MNRCPRCINCICTVAPRRKPKRKPRADRRGCISVKTSTHAQIVATAKRSGMTVMEWMDFLLAGLPEVGR